MFEFLRPLFLLLIPVVVVAFVWLKRYQGQASLKQVIAPHLASALIQGQTQRTQLHWWVLYLGIIASLALAGPSFRQVEVPIVQLKQARVIVMDMSMSMYATDLAPNRLTQAKYKALDLIGQQTEGEQALIAYAGDAFTISPLTQDSATILNLLPNLSPEIMPKPGSNPVAGLHRAIALLQNAGYQDGDIIFITDGISRKQSKDMADIVGQSDWRLSFLAAGSKKGAPITQPNGDLLKDQAGNIVIPQLKLAQLRQLARQTGGTLVTLSTSDKDIAALNQFAFNVAKDAAEKSEAQSMQSIDDGYWLMFLLAPFVLLGFRRGQVFSVAILAASLLPTQGHSQSIWQNDAQNAYQAFKQKNYEVAAELYQNPLAKGAAYFKAEQYEAAEEQFSQLDSADAWYNLANTQVKLEDFDAAISSYETALERQADHSQAAENLARLKDWLAQQKQNEQQEQQSQEQQNQEQQEQQDQNSQQNQQSQEQQEQQDQSSQQNQQSQEQQEQEQKDQGSQQNQQEQEQQEQEQEQQDQNSQQNQQSQEQQEQEQEQQDQNSQQNQQSQEQQEQEQEQQDQNSQQNQQGQEQQEQQDAMPASPEPSSEEQTPTATQAQLAQSDEEQGNETQEPMPVWLQQMADDPSILLRNKMRLEYQKRNKFTDEGETW